MKLRVKGDGLKQNGAVSDWYKSKIRNSEQGESEPTTTANWLSLSLLQPSAFA